jgi:hypothetical protein
VSEGPVARIAGWCRRCNVEHVLHNDVARAAQAQQAFFAELESPSHPLRGWLKATRGKMLAVAVVVDRHGAEQRVQAYSGDLGGVFDQPGCAPSIIRREDTAELEANTLSQLSTLQAALEATTDAEASQQLRRRRRALSATLMAAMHDAVRLTSAGGITQPLREVFVGGGMPSGTADCGLPKVLQQANHMGAVVVAVAEAWWGPNLGDRRHGVHQAPCTTRCVPILGHLLCPVRASGASV